MFRGQWDLNMLQTGLGSTVEVTVEVLWCVPFLSVTLVIIHCY